MKTTNIILLILISLNIFAQNANKSVTYSEAIATYKTLDATFDNAQLISYGNTDCGEPLHLFVISESKIFDPVRLHELSKCILFINNGIHPGEPDGIDASIDLAKYLLSNSAYKHLLENVVVCIVPVFNIDGALERGCCSRANQNGPQEYGFRANSRNLDLNRDFTKTDALSTRSLIQIIQKWNPDVFIDTHVSDGADYQYTMTLIPTQPDKINPLIGNFMRGILTPSLYDKMKDRNDEMIPYVETLDGKEIPDSGIVAFLETPRFLSGYLSLFNTISYISEAHMLKPFHRRRQSTLNLLVSLTELCDENFQNIISIRKKAIEKQSREKYYYFNWSCDFTKNESIDFKGYEAGYKKSKVTGNDRLYYDRNKPFNKKINYYNNFYPTDSFLIPKYFFIPQAFSEVIELLELNGIRYTRIPKDSVAYGTVTFIDSYETTKGPTEGHYLHSDVKTHSENQTVKMKKGDYLIPLPQVNMRYALETLIPRAVDSYFCWNYFDSFLQQKEWFSDYVYEDIAAALLEKDSKLKNDFEKWKSENQTADEYSQLNFIFQHSPNFEKTYRRYPVVGFY